LRRRQNLLLYQALCFDHACPQAGALAHRLVQRSLRALCPPRPSRCSRLAIL
jgi:hypothetical protein